MTFQKTKETMVKNYGTEYGNYILAFHGTKNESVETIIADNFNPYSTFSKAEFIKILINAS